MSEANDTPKVSIILPTYNGSRYLRESIDSCLNQTYRNIELIIVDDCSTDATPEIIRSYSDPRIKSLRNERNQRLPLSLNIGFAAATGDYLTWTSDDNQFLPVAIEKMLGCLRNNKDVDLVYADHYGLFLETGKKELRTMPDCADLGINNHIGPCFLYTRRIYTTIGGYDPKYELVEDYEYWMRIVNKFNVIHYPQPLFIYGEHAKSLTGTRQDSIQLFVSILKYRYGYVSHSQLRQAIRVFLVASFGSRLNRKETGQLWAKTLQSVFGLSLGFGIAFCFLLVSVLCLLSIRTLLKPIRAIAQDIKFRVGYSRLQASTSRQNVLCVVPHLLVGGAENVVLSIIRGLTPAGYGFHLFTVKKEDNQWCRNFASHFRNVVLLDDAYDEKRYYKYLKAVVRKLNIQTVLLTNARVAYRLLPRLRAEFRHLTIIDVLHAEGWAATSDEYLWVSPYVDKRVCISHHLQAYMTAKYRESKFEGRLEDRLVTIHNGIDMMQFRRNHSREGGFKAKHHIPDEVKIISFVGRFAREKNPLLFIEIARNLITKAPQEKFKFVMVGDGNDVNLVKKCIHKMGLENHFILTGMMDNVVELLADTWVLLVVSKSEGIPFVIIEGLSMDVPVISTDVGAIHEAVTDGFNGYLINPDDDVVEKFATRILQLATREQDHQQIASRARESVVSRFSIEHMAQGYREVLEELFLEKQPT